MTLKTTRSAGFSGRRAPASAPLPDFALMEGCGAEQRNKFIRNRQINPQTSVPTCDKETSDEPLKHFFTSCSVQKS